MRLIDADALKKVIHCEYSDDLGILDKINNAPTVWHPFTEEPKEEGQYLVQHFFKSWSGKIIIAFSVMSLETLQMAMALNKKQGNRDNHYQAWQKIEPYEEEENERYNFRHY